MADIEELSTVTSFVNYLVAHIIEEERLEFYDELREDEELDFDILLAMVESMGKQVYSEIPTQRS